MIFIKIKYRLGNFHDLKFIAKEAKMSLFEYEEGDYKYILKRHEIQRKRIICQEAKITTLKCLLFDQMSLFWEFHRVLGILPFSRDSERGKRFEHNRFSLFIISN